MAKTKTVSKEITFTELRDIWREKKYHALFLKGTDCAIFLNKSDLYIYSYADCSFGGSDTCDGSLKAYLRGNSVQYSYGLYDSSDWKRIQDLIMRTRFNDSHIDTMKKLVKEYRGFQKRTAAPQYGVELEVESNSALPREAIQREGGALIQDVGCDGSVRGGTEIRFNHPTLRGWKYKDVSKLLTFCKEKGATSEYGTAGMHVHISRGDIGVIVKKFAQNLDVMQGILYPINCRKRTNSNGTQSYGVNNNIYHDQLATFGTLEIRAWNSTLDPKLFMARIKFCKTLTDWLAKAKKVTIDGFFASLTQAEKKNYKYMLNHAENPHEWGFPVSAINAMLA